MNTLSKALTLGAAALAISVPAAGAASAATAGQVAPQAKVQYCTTSGTGDAKTCAQAVTWAKNHVHSGNESGYYNLCDHLVGLAYGFAHSGSATAAAHWAAIPSAYKHSAADTTVPAGALAFFGGGSGHVMISIGGGEFISNDIHGDGSYTRTTIDEITKTWGKPYLGWAQPWFQANH